MLRIYGNFIISNQDLTNQSELCVTDIQLVNNTPVETIQVYDHLTQLNRTKSITLQAQSYQLRVKLSQQNYSQLTYFLDITNSGGATTAFTSQQTTSVVSVFDTASTSTITVPATINGQTTIDTPTPQFFDANGDSVAINSGTFPNYTIDAPAQTISLIVAVSQDELIATQALCDRYELNGIFVDRSLTNRYHVNIPNIVLASDYQEVIEREETLLFDVIETSGSFYRIATL